MSTYLDIVGSVIIAGMLLLNFASFMDSKQDSEIEATNTVVRQENIRDVVLTMQHDLRKVGYGCDSSKIIKCNETMVAFRGDLENDGKLDTVVYFFGIKSIAVGAEAKNQLFRVVNNRKNSSTAVPLDKFALKYYDSKGIVTTTAADVKRIGVTMWVRDMVPVGGQYQGRKLEFSVSPRNLK
jgi:hypothetical protein